MDRRGFVAGLTCAISLPALPLWAASSTIDPKMFNAIYAGTNGYRARYSKGQLRYNKSLAQAATNYAAMLARTGKFSHTVGGTSLPQRVDRTGYDYHRLAENIGWAERRGTQVDIAHWFVKAWMESPSHRRNMLDGRLKELGVGITKLNNRYYAVQVFGAKT